MMGERRVAQEALFYEFSLERHVPAEHLLRAIDRVVDLSSLRAHLRPFYSEIGRPSIDPELMIRMLIIGYCFGIRSERRLCDEIHLNHGPGHRRHRRIRDLTATAEEGRDAVRAPQAHPEARSPQAPRSERG